MADLILKDVPEDVRKILLQQQLKEKEHRKTNQYSIALTVYKIIKEWNNKCKPVE
jgi:Na+/H+ antiporter NhaB